MTDRDDRQTQIEMLLAHLQQDVDQINESLTHHLQRMQEMDRRVQRIEQELELLGQPPENRDPEQERPPHY